MVTVPYPLLALRIGDRSIGSGSPCFIIAEAGVNHNGDLEMAKRLVDAAKASGADAVKFQTFKAEEVVSPIAQQADYQKSNTRVVEPQLDMVRRLQLSRGDHEALVAHCRTKGILFLSTPYDTGSVELLDELGVPAYKVGSGEMTNHVLLGYLARKGMPLLISTGMADMSEVDEAMRVVMAHGAPPVALLHCVSNYPVAPADCNLAAMSTLRAAFRVPVGWSDHTMGSHIAVAAVALGANIIEKHFTLDRDLPGPDHSASLEPDGLATMVQRIRDTEAALGTGEKKRRASEEDTARAARRSLFAAVDLAIGQRLRADDVRALRPGTGIPPDHLSVLLGRVVKRAIVAGSMLSEDDLE